MKNDVKQRLLDADTDRKVNAIYKIIDAKSAEIKASQSRIAKKNMAATKKK